MTRPYLRLPQLTSDNVTALLVTLAPLVYFFPAVRGRLIISPDDGVIFNIPLRAATANLIRAGYLPLWNPYLFSGMPLHGAAQAGVLFPLNWFYLVASVPVATNLMMLSTYMIAALGAYCYARRSGASIMGAALTSLVWQCSGFLILHIGHTNILHTAALLPWLLWAVDGYGASGKRSRGLLLSALVAIQVFAGHQQTFVYAILVAAAYAIVMWRATNAQKEPSPEAKQSQTAYLWSLIFIGAGLALAAVQILPTAELLRNSVRATTSYDFFTSFSLPPRFLWTFFAPYVVGGGDGYLFRAPYVGPAFYGEYVGYVGLATIALAVLAVVLKRDVRTRFWLVVAVAGLLLALGRFWPFQSYALLYYTPVLGLFRVPARHLMEAQFALAVLAGRGLTSIAEAKDRSKAFRWALLAAAFVVVMTCLAITVGRPANFQLGRTGPVSIMRAPELFMPVVIALATAIVIWWFAKQRRGATVLLFAVLLFDLFLWGQSSGWRVGSPRSDFELWSEPASVAFFRARQQQDMGFGPYRILTDEHSFDPNQADLKVPAGSPWVPMLQPDVYMMYGLENAAGYDGFGLARYSKLAGDMKIWGELSDPQRTLNSVEVDLLNVRYLLTRSATGAALFPTETTTITTTSSTAAEFPQATQVYGEQKFGAEDLHLPPISSGQRAAFTVPPIASDRLSLITNLAWSETLPDKTVVAHVRLHLQNREALQFEIRAGEHTSEWAHDRPDVRSRIRHKRAPVATSYDVADAQGKYEAHTYVSTFVLPGRPTVIGGEINVARIPPAPEVALSVVRIALADGERSFPLRAEWVKKETVPEKSESASEPVTDKGARWNRIAELDKVSVFENTRALPRAWLTASELVATEEEELSIIRSGKTAAGKSWNPLETALVESATGIPYEKGIDALRKAELTRNEPNRVEVRTESAAPAMLVLSANHYPGWRATVDGQPVEVARVNYNLRGVAVPAGKHLVTFVYRPKSVLIGLIVSLLTLSVLVAWTVGFDARLLSIAAAKQNGVRRD